MTKNSPVRALALATLLAFVAGTAHAVEEITWPRVHTSNGSQVTVFQPQVDSWTNHQTLHYRVALAVKAGSAKQESYGIAEVDAVTVVDTGARSVAVIPTARELRFPHATDAEATALRQVVDEVLPLNRAVLLSLDQVIAYVDEGSEAMQRPVEVSLDPPRLFYSKRPSILVIYLGKPRFEPIEKGREDLQFALNTNWDVFFDPAAQRYYLLNGDSWLTAPDAIAGPWTPAGILPAALSKLPQNDNWADVRANVPGVAVKQAPAVYTATEPAELIVTSGEPKLAAIPGTGLRRVTNSESTLFQHAGQGQYYFLVAGRWFRAKALSGPWSAASNDLPADFARIPDSDPAAFVKASVPGTRDAKDAVLLASVPTTMVVEVKPVTQTVSYSGAPQFATIEGTTVKIAVNSPESVFLVSDAYYWCHQGAWLTSAQPTGPWAYATSVPQAIYTIPASSPAHNVTYVVVQSSTPTQVVYSQTSGYSGEYVATNGVLMFGAGLIVGAMLASDDHCHSCYWYPPPPIYYSYGCGARYHYGYGGYFSAAHYYGPYGGAGRAAGYNPYTGTYARGAYAYGPAGSARVGQAYNPYTGAYARGGRVDTAYGSAGRFYASQGGRSVAGGYRSNAYGTAGAVRTSEGTGIAAASGARGSAVAWDGKYNQGAAARTKSGDVYAGSDGNVYKREQGGGWSQYNGSSGSWDSVDRPTPRQQSASTRATTAPAQAKPSTARPSTTSRQGSLSAESRQSLESQARSRQWSSQQSQRSSQFRSSTAARSGGTRSRRPRP